MGKEKVQGDVNTINVDYLLSLLNATNVLISEYDNIVKANQNEHADSIEHRENLAKLNKYTGLRQTILKELENKLDWVVEHA